MEACVNEFSSPDLRLNFQCIQGCATQILRNRLFIGTDVSMALETLNSIPGDHCISHLYPQNGFAGRRVSVGMVENTSLFTSLLLRITEGLMDDNYGNPFFGLLESNLNVVEDDHLMFRKYYQLPKPGFND